MTRVLTFSLVQLLYKYFICSLVLDIYMSSADISCHNQKDCYGIDEINCAICVDSSTSGVGKCVFPFAMLFNYKFHTRPACTVRDTCETRCSGIQHGICVRKWNFKNGDFFHNCKCHEGFSGWECQNTDIIKPTPMFVQVTFRYNFIIAPAERKYGHMSLDCGTTVPTMGSLEVLCEDKGYFQLVPLDRSRCALAIVLHNNPFQTRFPYLPTGNEDDKEILMLADQVLGYISSFRVTIMVGNTLNYQHSFPVFVSYQEVNLKCVPVVKLIGCSSSNKNVVKTTRSQYVQITSNVVFIADGKYVSTSTPQYHCGDSVTYQWRIWKNVNDDNITADLKYYDIKDLRLPPFHLEIGNYRVLLEVTRVQEEPSQNFAYCFFSVKYEPLVAIIDGGSERMVQKHLGLVLTTTRSKDPNMPSNRQSHMKASWSCIDTSDHNREICDPSKDLPILNSQFVPSENLHFGAIIKITLKVSTDYYDHCKTCGSVQPAFAFVTIIITMKSTSDEDDIYIQCLLNCELQVVSSEQLYLKVTTSSGSNFGNYVWTYYEKEKLKEISTDTISVQGLPNLMLLVKQNAFSSGKSYTILVKNKQERLLAKYSFDTIDVRFDGNCSMNPMHGTAGLSKFTILCENFTNNGRSFVFEFYDKSSREAEEGLVFSGRMMGTSTDGELRNFRVTRGQVFVYIKDHSGIYTHKQFKVNLSRWNITELFVNEVFKNITDSKNQHDLTKMIEYMSILPDVVPIEFNRSNILERLLPFVIEFPTKTLADVKITASALTNIVLTLNEPVRLEVKPGVMKTVVNIIQKQIERFALNLAMGTELNGMSSDEMKQLTKVHLTCLRAILMGKDPRTVGMNEFDMAFETEDSLLNTSISAVKVIHSVQNVLTFLQRPGLPPINVTSADSTYSVWVVRNDKDYDLTNYLTGRNGLPVSVSKHFLHQFEKSMSKSQEDLVVRLGTLDNLFWWRKSDIKSNLVSVSLAKCSKNNRLSKIKVVSRPLHIKMNLNHSLLNPKIISDITFKYEYNEKCSTIQDKLVKIHRFDSAPKSLITLRFLYPQTNGSLQVRVYRNHRPECDMMKQSVEISEQFPNYPLSLVQLDEPSFYYIGIIPGSSYINDTVRYTLQINTTVCQHWVSGSWSYQGCKISATNTEYSKVQCNCDHFSIIAAAFPVPPQETDPYSDISLFLTVHDNPVVVIFVSVVLLIYLVVSLWAYCRDRNDRMLRNVVHLDDNFPGDCYPYLLAVFTSSRFNAGTTANVGIRIMGRLASSRAHILASSERKTLRRNYDDWFVMYYSEPLGDLMSIHLWHDNSGSSPDWFCDKIVVYDLRDNLDAVFVIGQWLALRPNCYPEVNVSAATINQVKNVKRMFLDNCVLGLREGHIVLSIVSNHPRSIMSRLQKVTVFMCCIMVTMLCSIMFYSPNVDEDDFSISMRDFYISIQSLFITSVITFLVLYAFKNSYPYTYNMHRTTTLYKTDSFEEYDALQNIQKKTTWYAGYVKFVSQRLKWRPMVPVHMSSESQYLFKKKRGCVVISWVFCITVIVACSFYVMLCGLKLGLVKSKMWMSSVLFTLSQELFIVGPLKIVILSFLLSLAFQTISETNTHEIFVEDLLRAKPPGETLDYKRLSTIRKHPMYAPLRHDAIDEMIRITELKYKCQTMIDFIVSLVFIIILSMVMNDLCISHYNTNRHVNNIVTPSKSPKMGSKPFRDIRNVPDMETYLHTSLFPALYVKFWYNKNDPIIEEGVNRGYWMRDFTLRKIGVERLRQIRVTSVSCSFKYLHTNRSCIPRWDPSHEDTQDYSVNWRVAQWYDLQVKNSPWKYTQSSLGTVYTMYRLTSESGTLFHDGGYLTYLGPEWLTTERDISELIYSHWQDQLTRAVFVEFTLYNVNENLFSHVTIIVEYLISGNIKLRTNVLSIESDIKPTVWNALLAVFIIYFIVRSGSLINRQGLMEFLSSSRNLTQVLVTVLSVLCIFVATVHYFHSAAAYDGFHKSGQSSFFDFDSFAFNFLLLQSLLVLLFCLAVLQSVLTLSQVRSVVNFFYTLTLATPYILCLTVVFITFLLLQLYWMFFLYVYSFSSIQEVIINPTFNVPENYNATSTGVFFLVKSLIVWIVLKFYFVVFTHSFRIARSHKLKESETFSWTTYILDKVLKRHK